MSVSASRLFSQLPWKTVTAFSLTLLLSSSAFAAPVELTFAEQAWLKAHPVIRTRISPDYPPFESYENGSFKGMTNDYIDILAGKLGVRFEPVSNRTWKESLEQLKDRTGVDLVALITKDPSRDSFIEFTNDYIAFPAVIITRKDSRFVSSDKDLQGTTLANEKDFIGTDWLKRDIPGVKIRETDSTDEALELVSSGKAEAYIGNLAVASYIIEKKGLVNLKVAAPSRYGDDRYAMGVRKDWPELASIINKTLASMTEEEHRQIRQKWLSVRYEHGIRPLDVLKWVALASGILLIFIFQLRRMVKQRTASLQKSIQELKDTHRKLSDIIEFLPDPTFVIDRQGYVLAWNRAMETMTGINKSEMLGKGGYSYSAPFYGELRPMLADYVLHDDTAKHQKFVTISQNGTILEAKNFAPTLNNGEGAFIFATASPLTNDSGTIIGAIESLRDITSIRKNEEEITALNTELESRVRIRTAELEKANQQLESFAYSVSHDLKAPLRHISSFAAILTDEHSAQLDQEGFALLQRIRRNCSRMDDMINAMFDLAQSSRQNLHKRLVNMNQLAEEVIADLRDEQTQIRLGNLPDAVADPVLLKQVLVNLIGNAFKFSRNSNPAEIEISTETIDGKIVYTVRDNGIGFDMQYAENLFGIFQKLHADPDLEGSGVGLSIVHNIVHRHGGRIWADSSPGKGATFYFTLE